MIGSIERLVLGAVLVTVEKDKSLAGASEGQIIHLTGQPKVKVRHYLETLTQMGCLTKVVTCDPVIWSLTDLGKAEVTRYRQNRRIPDDVRKIVLQRDGTLCANTFCEKRNGLAMSLLATEYDHKHPWAGGGDNHEDNVQMMCVICNRRKGAMRMENFLRLEETKVKQGDCYDPLVSAPRERLIILKQQVDKLLSLGADKESA